MLAVQKWAKDKPYIIKTFAAQLVSTVQYMDEEFKTLKLWRFASQKFPSPHLSSWFAMYRFHRKTIQQINDIWSVAWGRKAVDIFSELLNVKNQSENNLPFKPSQEDIEGAI